MITNNCDLQKAAVLLQGGAGVVASACRAENSFDNSLHDIKFNMKLQEYFVKT